LAISTIISRARTECSREELVAELGAAFLCADLGITPEILADHADYVGHWLNVLPRRQARDFQRSGSRATGCRLSARSPAKSWRPPARMTLA
jgi:antirestriction protein ArdC